MERWEWASSWKRYGTECGSRVAAAASRGRKVDCHRDTGIAPKTIRKWWDSFSSEEGNT